MNAPTTARLLALCTFSVISLSAFSVGHAAPTITGVEGTPSEGEEITIRGFGFGSKPKPSPEHWDTVDNQEQHYQHLDSGSPIPDGANYPYANTVNDVYLDRITHSERRYTGDETRYMTQGDGALSSPSALGGMSAPKSQKQLYVRYWSKFEIGPFEKINNSSHKFMRIWTGKGQDLRISWTQQQLYITNNNAGGATAQTKWNNYSGNPKEWNLHELWVDIEKGEIDIHVNGQPEYEYRNSDPRYLTADQPTGLRIAQIGWDPANGTNEVSGQKQWLDDIYIDRTRSRVVLSDAPNWSDVRTSAIQIPNAWSDDSISITLNKRMLESHSGELYLYVVASDGTANANGAALSCSQCPNPPSSVEVR